ncbi:MAG: HXXEE domain-containing protein [Acidobacteria bacterium]|nr:HXXEE domain-containing protein [Acidobacteriota bacterium]
MTRQQTFWMVALLFAIHNAEEALTAARYRPIARAALPEVLGPVLAGVTDPAQLGTLLLVTLIPAVLATWAQNRPGSHHARWAMLLVQGVLLLNVVWHVAVATLVFGGYAPGLATALAVNLPFSVYLFRRAGTEAWVGRRALMAIVPSALLVHGPILARLLFAIGAINRR